MNWSRAKTILIFLFLCTALFQFFVIFTTGNTADVSDEVIASSAEILSHNKISIDTEIVPKKNYTIYGVDADNAVWDYDEFAKIILGDNMTKTDDVTFASDKGNLSFSGNNFEFTAKEGIPLTSPVYAKKFLKDLGLDMDHANESTKESGNTKTLTFTNSIGEFPLFNSQIDMEISKDKITKISGIWFNHAEKKASLQLKSITSVLIELINYDIKKPN